MRYRCHISLNEETINKINDFGEINNIKTFSKSLEKLVFYGLYFDNINGNLDSILKNITILKNRVLKNEKLLKQLYSDLNLTYHTKVSSNEELKKIEHDIFKSVNNMEYYD